MNRKRKTLPRHGTLDRTKHDAFYGGVCCALSAAFYHGDGTETEYVEVVASVGPDELLNYARREKDIEFANIRRAVREIKRRDAL